jgi:hypothetical protein
MQVIPYFCGISFRIFAVFYSVFLRYFISYFCAILFMPLSSSCRRCLDMGIGIDHLAYTALLVSPLQIVGDADYRH